MDSLQELEAAVATQGAAVRTKKEAGEDVAEALAALGTAKAALKEAIDKILPSVEVGSPDYHALRDKLVPLITDKSARRKLEKDIKKAKKASAAGGAAPAATATAGAKQAKGKGQKQGNDNKKNDGKGNKGKQKGGGKKAKGGKGAGPVAVPAVCRSLLVVQVADLHNGNAHMCLAAAALAKADLATVRVCVVDNVPAHAQIFFPALRVDLNTTLHGSGAVCRYFLADSPLSPAQDNAAEWAAEVLAPASAHEDPVHFASALTELAASVVSKDGPFFCGAEASLADVMLASTLVAANGGGAGAGGDASDRLVHVEGQEWFSTTRRQVRRLQVKYGSTKLRESIEARFCCTLNGMAELQECQLRGADLDVDQIVDLRRSSRKPAHFQLDFALKLVSVFKRFGVAGAQFTSPQNLAKHVIGLAPADTRIKDLSLSGPGFIAVTISNECLSSMLQHVMKGGIEPPATLPARVCVDYSSPNIAKDMHVGHLRSTIIGDSLSRVLEFCGDEVTRLNHVGDWGTQFGMLIAHLKETFPDFLTNTPEVQELTEFYKAAKKRFSEEEDFKKRAYTEVVALQAGDEINTRLWRALCAVSERMFSDIYARLNISDKLTVQGESFYQSRINPMLDELQSKGLLEDDDGMKCMKIEGQKVPLIVRKSDGGFGYDSTDLAAIRYRFVECKFDRAIYVVDAGQALHFNLVFAGAAKAGWMSEGQVAEHCKFGLVCGDDGKRYRTRDGGVVRLVDLLDEARDRALAAIKERAAQGTGRAEDGAALETAEALAYSGVKYFDLNRDRMRDYIFSYDAMLNPAGDTAVYLQYAHARMSSILAKSGKNIAKLENSVTIELVDEAEVDLAMEVLSLPYALEVVRRDLQLLPLCKWLRDLCVQFSTFVHHCRVLGSDNEDSRLLVVHATAKAMRQVMGLLGMDVVERL